MAGYYCHIVAITRGESSNINVEYEVRNGDLVTFAVLSDRNLIGVQVPLTGNAAARKADVLAQLQTAFQNIIDRANGVDVVLTGAQQLVNLNFPAAP